MIDFRYLKPGANQESENLIYMTYFVKDEVHLLKFGNDRVRLSARYIHCARKRPLDLAHTSAGGSS